MEAERLRQVLAELSDTLVSLQRQIEQANQLLTNTTLFNNASPSPSSRSVTGSERHSPSVSQSPRIRQLEGRIEELETSERELTGHLERLLHQHEMCETEVGSAVRAREEIMKQYRLLVRVTAELLENVMQGFPPEEYDEDIRNAVESDLRSSLRTPSTRTSSPGRSSSSGTARPRARQTEQGSNKRVHSVDTKEPQAGPSRFTEIRYTSNTASQASVASQSPAVRQDGTLLTWQIHTGSNCPSSVKTTAGPFIREDFVRLGIDKNELEDLFEGLILPDDVCIRLAIPPRSPRGLGGVKLVFLYDPFYLESGTKTYILDWVTPQANEGIINWLKNSARGDESPVFHTFTLSKKKRRWYYFGGLRWSLAPLGIWPTLNAQSRASILKHLSDRSHGAVAPEEVGRRMADGRLQELCIEIASADEMEVMQEVATRLGRSPQAVRAKRPNNVENSETRKS